MDTPVAVCMVMDDLRRIIEALLVAIERNLCIIKVVSMYTDNLEVLWLILGRHTPGQSDAVQLVKAMEGIISKHMYGICQIKHFQVVNIKSFQNTGLNP